MQVKCLNCNKSFEKANNQIKRSPNHYCCRSCSATANNKKQPRRKFEGKCHKCESVISKSLKYCKKCHQEVFNWLEDDTTIKEAIYTQHHKSSAFALIRSRARTIAKQLGWDSCRECGYSKHIEIAHIKAISSFPESTKLKVVNSPSNLLPLCPNCHWEHDNT